MGVRDVVELVGHMNRCLHSFPKEFFDRQPLRQSSAKGTGEDQFDPSWRQKFMSHLLARLPWLELFGEEDGKETGRQLPVSGKGDRLSILTEMLVALSRALDQLHNLRAVLHQTMYKCFFRIAHAYATWKKRSEAGQEDPNSSKLSLTVPQTPHRCASTMRMVAGMRMKCQQAKGHLLRSGPSANEHGEVVRRKSRHVSRLPL